MANRPRLKGVKRHRKIGHRPKHNKKSVALRRRLRKEKFKRELKVVMKDSKISEKLADVSRRD